MLWALGPRIFFSSWQNLWLPVLVCRWIFKTNKKIFGAWGSDENEKGRRNKRVLWKIAINQNINNIPFQQRQHYEKQFNFIYQHFFSTRISRIGLILMFYTPRDTSFKPLSLSRTHNHFLSHLPSMSHKHTHSLTLSLIPVHKQTFSLSYTPPLYLTCIYSHTLSLSQTHTLTLLSHFISHT